jgi:hypothetical protein
VESMMKTVSGCSFCWLNLIANIIYAFANDLSHL